MGKKRRQYTKEFKIEAVRLIIEEGRPISEVARELGIGENLLHRWKKKYEEGKIDPFPGQGRLSPEDEELRRLRRENERLRMEHEILKKAVAIFSEEPRGSSQKAGYSRTDMDPLAQGIGWITSRSSQGVQGVGEGEYSVKAMGSGFESG